jgi:F-box and WD-40 domain protein CDC4
VWSFSPPEDEIMDDYRSSSPVSMPDQNMDDYHRQQESRSMPNLTQGVESEEQTDVTMSDVADENYFNSGPGEVPKE